MAGNRKVLVKAIFIGALVGLVSGAVLIVGHTDVESSIHALPYTRPGKPHGFLPFDLVRVLWQPALFGVPGGAIGGLLGAYVGKRMSTEFYAPWIGCIMGAAILGYIGAFIIILYTIAKAFSEPTGSILH